MPFVWAEFCHADFAHDVIPSQHSRNGSLGPREASSGSLRLLCRRSLGSSNLARESGCLPAIANPLSRALRCEPTPMVCKIFDSELAMPILAAPTAFHRLAHRDGELPTARGIGAAKTLIVLSSLSTCRLENVAAAASGPLWFQAYINKDRGFTRELLQRAVAAGFKAIVVTCDAPCWSVREADIRNGFPH